MTVPFPISSATTQDYVVRPKISKAPLTSLNPIGLQTVLCSPVLIRHALYLIPLSTRPGTSQPLNLMDLTFLLVLKAIKISQLHLLEEAVGHSFLSLLQRLLPTAFAGQSTQECDLSHLVCHVVSSPSRP